MGRYFVRRLILVIPTLFLVSIMVFSMIRLIPGDIVSMMLEEYQYAKNVEELKQKLGLDKPIHLQYIDWLINLSKGNLGVSLWTKRSALEELRTRFPVTMELSLISILFSLVIALPVGIVAGIRQDSWIDYICRSFTIGALSIPGFWLATLYLVVPSILFKRAPPIGDFTSFSADPLGHIRQFIFPAFAMGLAQSGVIMRMTRAMILEVLRQDYILAARAKGLKESVLILRHALRNALIPIVDIIGIQMPFYFGGTIIMEYIFGLPGIGSLAFEVISKRDYPMIQAITLFIAFLIVLTNLIVDLSYGYLDPRIRYKGY
jgi:peptide/nickel transport system permease protein